MRRSVVMIGVRLLTTFGLCSVYGGCQVEQRVLQEKSASPSGCERLPATQKIADFSPDNMGGLIYKYPATGSGAITHVVSNGALRITGRVSGFSGFGLAIDEHQEVDASAFSGVAFRVQGVSGPTNTLRFSVGTGEDSWQSPERSSCFTCVAEEAAQYDRCSSPFTSVPVSTTGNTVLVPFTDLKDGVPHPTVNTKSIVQLQWEFSWPPSADSTQPYDVDLTLDDVSFIPR